MALKPLRNRWTRRRLFKGAGAMLAGVAGWGGLARNALAYPERAIPKTLREVLNVFHLDRVAQRKLPAAAYHFIVDAADDGATKTANRQAFQSARIRPRRLVDVSQLDTSLSLFGERYTSPILLAPIGNQGLVHEDAELATARAAERKGHAMIASMMTNHSIAEIAGEGAVNWMQLYPSPSREFMRKLIVDAETVGCRALVLTVDGPGRGNHEASRWFSMHRDRTQPQAPVRIGNFENFAGRKGIGDSSFDWRDVEWLREQTRLPLVLKGIVTAADAKLARRHGAAGLIVSNHGGRQEGSGIGTLQALPEIVAEVGGRMPVLLDGGVRRGTDVFKALALGADAVCIGRPYMWGLGAFGQPGVEKCLDILTREFEHTMRLAGTPALADITRDHVRVESALAG